MFELKFFMFGAAFPIFGLAFPMRNPSSIRIRVHAPPEVATIQHQRDESTNKGCMLEDVINQVQIKKIICDTVRDEVSSMIKNDPTAVSIDCFTNSFASDLAAGLCGIISTSLVLGNLSYSEVDMKSNDPVRRLALTKPAIEVNLRVTVNDQENEMPIMTKYPIPNIYSPTKKDEVIQHVVERKMNWRHASTMVVKRIILPLLVHSLAHTLAGESIHGLAAEVPELLKFMED